MVIMNAICSISTYFMANQAVVPLARAIVDKEHPPPLPSDPVVNQDRLAPWISVTGVGSMAPSPPQPRPKWRPPPTPCLARGICSARLMQTFSPVAHKL
mmetsp:Transcript_111298/g.193131  ORF Transcript_111298/g.193131 Transcript_111298/m.193131 type:complete len:99 (+) Transcript_111298:828-1124(+)